jgi:cytochrome c-type biogenesis protein CcmH/NrfG
MAKNRQNLPSQASKHKYLWWDVLIGVGILLHLGMITTICVVHRKISVLEAQVEMNPNLEEQLFSYSSNAHNPQTVIAYQQKEAELKGKLGNHPQDVKTQENLAQLYYEQGKISDAITQYKKILELNPKDLEAHFLLGQLYMGDNRFAQEAIKHFQEVLNLKPDHTKRKSIAMWMEQLKKQSEEEKAMPSMNHRGRDGLLARLKKKLAMESKLEKKTKLESMIQQLEKQVSQKDDVND